MAERRQVPTPPVYPITAIISGLGIEEVFAFLLALGDAAEDGSADDIIPDVVVEIVVTAKLRREIPLLSDDTEFRRGITARRNNNSFLINVQQDRSK